MTNAEQFNANLFITDKFVLCFELFVLLQLNLLKLGQPCNYKLH